MYYQISLQIVGKDVRSKGKTFCLFNNLLVAI